MSNNYINIEAVYRITTPMFCGGADQNTAELRLPSFKGALRFWWRSMMWGKVKDVEKLQAKEAALFGSSDQGVGQSKVRMQLLPEDLESVGKGGVFAGGRLKGAQYLGYGVMNHRGILSRSMIPGGPFTVRLKLGPKLETEQSDEVRNALILLGTVGGLGSKSRKGFGSLTLTSLKTDGELHELDSDPIWPVSGCLYLLPVQCTFSIQLQQSSAMQHAMPVTKSLPHFQHLLLSQTTTQNDSVCLQQQFALK